jgi:hypothetical protein
MPDPKPDEQLMKSLIGKLYTIVTAGAEGKPPSEPQLVAWCTPGLPLQTQDLAFAARGLTGKSGDEARSLTSQASAFSTLVDYLPSDSGTYVQSGRRLSAFYSDVIDRAQVPRDVLSEADSASLENAMKRVGPVEKERENLATGEMEKYLEPPRLEVAYRAGQKAYDDALRALNTVLIAANNSESAAAVQELTYNGDALRRSVETASASWIATGYKLEYETLVATIASLTGRSMQRRLQALRNTRDAMRLTDLTGARFFYTSVVPPAFLVSNEGWTKFTFDESSSSAYDRAETNGFTSKAGGSWGLFSAAATAKGEFAKKDMSLDTSNFKMEFELTQVAIARPWFDADFLQSDRWRFREAGDGKPLVYPTALVLARNVTLDFAELHKKGSEYKEAIEAGLDASYGPFTLSGTYKRGVDEKKLDTKTGDAGLQVGGMQIIGFRCAVMPKVPNPNPAITDWQ